MNAPARELTCASATELMRDVVEGVVDAEEAQAFRAHLDGCAACAQELESRRKVLDLLGAAFGPRRISPSYEDQATRRLHEMKKRTTSSQPVAMPTTGAVPVLLIGEGEEQLLPPPAGVLDRLAQRFGAAPWWTISGAFHALLLLLIALIGMAVLRVEKRDTVIVTSLQKQPEEKPEEKEKPREIFKQPQALETTETVQPQPEVVLHEEVEVADHAETDDDRESQDAFGDEGVSDIPLGGSGFSGALGTGGGGAGAFGRPLGGGRQRLSRAMRGGGNQATESAVDKALEWLARNQEPEGFWSSGKHRGEKNKGAWEMEVFDTGVTGLALLAFLGAGHTEKVGKYKDNVQRAVSWLISVQNEKGFIYRGRLKQPERGWNAHPGGYGHGIAGLALAEAAAMGRVARTREAAQKAVDYSVNVHQHKPNGDPSARLGWRYAPDYPIGDTSVVGWYVMQLKSAKVAGLSVDPVAFEGAQRFLETVLLEKPNPSDPYAGPTYGYCRDGAGNSGTGVYLGDIRIKDLGCNTAVGILCRQYLGARPEDLQGGVESFATLDGYREALVRLKQAGLARNYGGFHGGPPNWDRVNYYYWYYGTLCCFQQGGDLWKGWNEAMKKTLLENQCKAGADDGSWPPEGAWVGNAYGAGRVMSTALGCMCLEVYYRYLPIYR